MLHEAGSWFSFQLYSSKYKLINLRDEKSSRLPVSEVSCSNLAWIILSNRPKNEPHKPTRSLFDENFWFIFVSQIENLHPREKEGAIFPNMNKKINRNYKLLRNRAPKQMYTYKSIYIMYIIVLADNLQINS